MNWLPSSLWIFLIALFSLLMAGMFPSPAMIGIVALVTSALVLLQVFLILRAAPEAEASVECLPLPEQRGEV